MYTRPSKFVFARTYGKEAAWSMWKLGTARVSELALQFHSIPPRLSPREITTEIKAINGRKWHTVAM